MQKTTTFLDTKWRYTRHVLGVTNSLIYLLFFSNLDTKDTPYQIKIVPDFCCMETSERVLVTGVESCQSTAIKRAVFCYGNTIFPWGDVTEVKKIQQLPAFTENHSEKKNKEKKKPTWGTNTVTKSKHCAALSGFLEPCWQEKARRRYVSENKKHVYVGTKPWSKQWLSADAHLHHLPVLPSALFHFICWDN